MEFPKALKQCQLKMHMTNENFSKYLGRSRAWLQGVYTKNPKIRKFLLGERTMFEINEKLGIPIEIMEQYNEEMLVRYHEQVQEGRE